MHRGQVKSAPPRLKSKFVKNRTNAMKEIQAWIKKDEEFSVPEASRMSGQLSDNVTEERMLKAKLWELSKERYKFLSQNSYEKKVFQDRQQRKANSRRVVSADGRSRHTSEDARQERRSSLGDMPQKPKIRNARLALLNRLDPTNKNRGRGKKTNAEQADKDGKQTPSRAYSRANSSMSMLKHKDSQMSITQGAIEKKMSSLPRRTETPSERKQTTNNDDSSTNETKRTASSAKRPKTAHASAPLSATSSKTPDQKSSESGQTSSTPQPAAGTSASAAATPGVQGSNWNKPHPTRCPRQYGMRVESKVSDPRYALLEQRLSPLIQSNSNADVNSIVNTIESLHVRPKRRPVDPNRSRTKIEVKALEFIKEKGFVF